MHASKLDSYNYELNFLIILQNNFKQYEENLHLFDKKKLNYKESSSVDKSNIFIKIILILFIDILTSLFF